MKLCKFHWKPVLGMASLVWDEAQKIAGKDPDFHRRDLWESIGSGAFPEWELGVQVIDEGDEEKYGFDMLDPTKLLPEELVPVQIIGKLTLDRNPDNFFAETEQAAFCVQNDPRALRRAWCSPTSPRRHSRPPSRPPWRSIVTGLASKRT